MHIHGKTLGYSLISRKEGFLEGGSRKNKLAQML